MLPGIADLHLSFKQTCIISIIFEQYDHFSSVFLHCTTKRIIRKPKQKRKPLLYSVCYWCEMYRSPSITLTDYTLAAPECTQKLPQNITLVSFLKASIFIERLFQKCHYSGLDIGDKVFSLVPKRPNLHRPVAGVGTWKVLDRFILHS